MGTREDKIFDNIMSNIKNEPQNTDLWADIVLSFRELASVFTFRYRIVAMVAVLIGFVSTSQYLSANETYEIETVNYSLMDVTFTSIETAYLGE